MVKQHGQLYCNHVEPFPEEKKIELGYSRSHNPKKELIRYAPATRTDVLSHDMTHLSRNTIKPTKWHVRPAKTQISLGIRPTWSESSLCAQWIAKNTRLLQAGSDASDQTDLSLQGAQVILFMSCSGSYMYYDWRYSLYLHRTIEVISFIQLDLVMPVFFC